MEIVKRYLHAIEFWLPKGQKQDIIAEISEDLHSQIEEKQEQLGRALSESELETLIQQRGRPVLVASRYAPQQSLIGPALFPIYVFVLKIGALCYLAPWAAVFITIHRLQHPALGWGETIGAAVGSLWTAVVLGAGVITMVFAALERIEARTHFLQNWNPRRLPPARNPNEIPRANSIFELVVSVFAVFWLTRYASLELLNGPKFHLWLAPVAMYFFGGFLIVSLLNTGLSAVNLARPYWTTVRALFRLGTGAIGAALFCWLLKANVIATLAIAGVAPSRALEIKNAIHMWMDRAFPFAVIGMLAILASDAYRVIRVNRSGAGPSRQTAAALHPPAASLTL